MRTLATSVALAALSFSAHAQLVFEPRLETSAPGKPGVLFTPRAATGDVDGDGDADVVTGVDPLLVLLNDGDGAFTTTTTTFLGRSDVVCLADLDGDGDLDLVRSVDGDTTTALGAGDGTFGAETILAIPSAGGEVADLVVTDMTNDGLPDVIEVRRFPSSTYLGVGAGDGTISSSVLIKGDQPSLLPASASVGDIDGDVFPDVALVVAGVGTASLLLLTSQGGTSFVELQSIGLGGGGMNKVHLGDVTDDGIDDLVVAGILGVGLFRGLGGGAFAPVQLFTSKACDSELVVADLDGDGVVDLSYVHDVDGLGITTYAELLTLRGPSFTSTLAATAVGVRSADLEAVDFDGDGRPDISHTATLTGGTFGTYEHMWLRNRTYLAGEPWTDVGQGVATTQFPTISGQPILIAEGSLEVGSQLTLELYSNQVGAFNSNGFLVLGLSQLGAPFKGGTMVPNPDLVLGPLSLPPLPAALELPATIPVDVPSGAELVFQLWLPVFAASSGVVGVTP